MIRKLYIFNTNGECIALIDFNSIVIEEECKSQKTSDPQMISDLFSAIITFADETVGADYSHISNTINSVACKSVIYYFQQRDNFYFILEKDVNLDSFQSEDIAELLNQITPLCLNQTKQGFGKFSELQMDNKYQLIEAIKTIVAKAVRKSLLKNK